MSDNTNMLEEMQSIAFQMISVVGTAKSMYIEALQLAKKGEFEEADKLFEEGNTIFADGHKLHFDIVQKEANGTELPFSVLFMHAEDQMLNTETIKILVEELIYLHKN